MGAANEYMESAANTMYELSSDRMVKEQCRRRAAYENFQRYQAAKISAFQQENADLKKKIADKDAALADREAALADKDAALADRDAALADKEAALAEQKILIDQLKNQLAAMLQNE